MGPDIAQAFFTMMLNAGFALVVGCLISALLLPNVRNQHWWIYGRLVNALKFGILMCIAGTLLSLWQTSASMGDVGLLESGPALWRLFIPTHYGSVGLASVALLIVSAIAVLFLSKGQPTRTPIIICAAALVIYAVCRVSVSHAYESGLVSMAVLVEWLHLVLMSMWVGLVLTAGWIVLPGSYATQASQNDIKRYLSSVSSWATVALFGILATGIYNAFRVLSAPHDFIATQYGWTLVAKLVLVAVAILLGGWNRFYGFPKASAASGKIENESNALMSATLVLRIESVALLGVLAVAAFLTGSAPPASM